MSGWCNWDEKKYIYSCSLFPLCPWKCPCVPGVGIIAVPHLFPALRVTWFTVTSALTRCASATRCPLLQGCIWRVPNLFWRPLWPRLTCVFLWEFTCTRGTCVEMQVTFSESRLAKVWQKQEAHTHAQDASCDRTLLVLVYRVLLTQNAVFAVSDGKCCFQCMLPCGPFHQLLGDQKDASR